MGSDETGPVVDRESDADTLAAVCEELERLRAHTETLHERVATLETELQQKDDRIDRLERERDALRNRVQTLEDETDDLERDVDELERDAEHRDTKRIELERLVEATRKKANTTKARVAELQARELEKGAHLQAVHVDTHEIEVPDNRLEKLTKSDGRVYYRLPEREDPLERGGDATLAYGDLLPIQQLARMDEDMRRSAANALPTRLAARLWQARTDPSVGDDPWQQGCKDVAAYVTASDLKHWIRRREPGTSEAYAKKLVSRTIDAVLELSNHRLAVRKRTQRKNGLEYTERRLILPADAEIPGADTTGRPSSSDDSGPSSKTADARSGDDGGRSGDDNGRSEDS